MKLKGLLLSFAAIAVSITSATLVFKSINSSSRPIEVDASSRELTSGLFYKVESTSDIKVGDHIIFVSSSGYVLDDAWGNPAYLHGTHNGIEITADKSLAFLQSCSATVFTVEEGMIDNSFSFKGSMSIGGIYKEDVYLAQTSKEYFGTDTFGDAAYFFEKEFGLDVSKNNGSPHYSNSESNTNWYLREVDNDTGISIENVYEYNGQRGKLTYSPDFRNGMFLRTPSMWGHYPYITRQETYIYKLLDQRETTSYSISVLTHMSKTEYKHGEEIDLTGLKLNLRIVVQGADTFNQDYNFKDNEKLFTYQKYAYGNGPATLNITFVGYAFNESIYVNREEASAGKQTEALHDYRGTFMLVVGNNGNSLALKANTVVIDQAHDLSGVESALLTSPDGKPERRVAADANDDPYLRFEIDRDHYSGFNYVLKCSSNNLYLSYGTYATLSDTETAFERFSIESTQNGIRIKSTGNNQYLYYDEDHDYFQFGSVNAGLPVYLWKYGTTDEEFAGLNTFVNDFLTATDVCDPDGQVNRITKSAWDALRDEFNALSLEAQGILANITYTHGEEQSRSIEDMVDRYDYITAKYLYSGDYDPLNPYDYVLEDFIHRIFAGVNPYSGAFITQNNNPISISIDYSMTIVVIVILSIGVIGFAALYIKKKKEAE